MTNNQIVKYSITDAQIAEMGEQYSKLKIMDIHDKVGFQAVHSARMICVGKRSKIEEDRKEGKKGVLEVGRTIDLEAKRLTGLVAEIEAPLEVEENRVTAERERLRAEAEAERERTRAAENERITARILAVARYGIQISFFDAGALTEEEFDERLNIVRLDWEATEAEKDIKNRARELEEKINAEAAERERVEKQRISARVLEIALYGVKISLLDAGALTEEQLDARLNTARLNWETEAERADAEQAAEREQLDQIRRDQATQGERLEKIRCDQAEERRGIDEEKQKMEAEKNRMETAAHEAEREQALRPDMERLRVWVVNMSMPDPPPVTSGAGAQIVAYASEQFSDFCRRVREAILLGEGKT